MCGAQAVDRSAKCSSIGHRPGACALHLAAMKTKLCLVYQRRYEVFRGLSLPLVKESKGGISSWFTANTKPASIQDCLAAFTADEVRDLIRSSDI